MSPLLCTIYKGTREDEMYLYVEKGSDLSQIPTELLTRLGTLKEVMTLALTADRKLARVQTEKVLEDIQSKGYFLQLPPNIHAPVFTYGE